MNDNNLDNLLFLNLLAEIVKRCRGKIYFSTHITKELEIQIWFLLVNTPTKNMPWAGG